MNENLKTQNNFFFYVKLKVSEILDKVSSLLLVSHKRLVEKKKYSNFFYLKILNFQQKFCILVSEISLSMST